MSEGTLRPQHDRRFEDANGSSVQFHVDNHGFASVSEEALSGMLLALGMKEIKPKEKK